MSFKDLLVTAVSLNGIVVAVLFVTIILINGSYGFRHPQYRNTPGNVLRDLGAVIRQEQRASIRTFYRVVRLVLLIASLSFLVLLVLLFLRNTAPQ